MVDSKENYKFDLGVKGLNFACTNIIMWADVCTYYGLTDSIKSISHVITLACLLEWNFKCEKKKYIPWLAFLCSSGEANFLN